jgi:hypothetical protein
MRHALRLATAVTLVLISAGAAAQAKSGGTPFVQYAYEQDGTDFFAPFCSPSFDNCSVYQFEDVWALTTTPPDSDADGNAIEPADYTADGSLVDHGFDYFQGHTTTGTFSLTLDSGPTVWSGGYKGTFRGPSAGTGTFSLFGTNGTRLTGTIAFLGDGVMRLSGTIG